MRRGWRSPQRSASSQCEVWENVEWVPFRHHDGTAEKSETTIRNGRVRCAGGSATRTPTREGPNDEAGWLGGDRNQEVP